MLEIQSEPNSACDVPTHDLTSLCKTAHFQEILSPRRNGASTRWTDESAADLKQWWGEGCSAGVCAKRINDKYQTTFTRSAVMGRVWRDNLPKHGRAPALQMPRSGGWVASRAKRPEKYKPRKLKACLGVVPDITDTLIPFEQRKTFMQLGRGDCRWPVNDPGTPEFFFCGDKKLETGSYCAGHCQRAIGYTRRSRMTPTFKYFGR